MNFELWFSTRSHKEFFKIFLWRIPKTRLVKESWKAK